MSNHDLKTKFIGAVLVLLFLLAGTIGLFVLKPRQPQPLALAEGRLLGFGPDPHLAVTVIEIAGVDLSSGHGVRVRIQVRNTAAGSFELSPSRVRLALQDRSGSEVPPANIAWLSGERELRAGDKISAREVAQGRAIFPVAGGFQPAELILWIDMGWAEKIPFLKTSLLNPRLAIPIDAESLATPGIRSGPEKGSDPKGATPE